MPAAAIGRFRASLALGALVIGPMVLTIGHPSRHARIRSRLGVSWLLLRRGELWRLFTSTFVQSGHGVVGGIAVVLVAVPLAESAIGPALTALVFLAGDWLSTAVVLIGARLAAAAGSASALHVLGHLDSGASAACYACAGAFVASLGRGRLRTVAVVVLVGDLAVEGAVTHMLAEVQHPIAALIGAGIVVAARARGTAGVHAPGVEMASRA